MDCGFHFQTFDVNILNCRITPNCDNQIFALKFVPELEEFLHDPHGFLKDDLIYNFHNTNILNSVLLEELHAIHLSNNSDNEGIEHQVKYQVIDRSEERRVGKECRERG